MKLIKYISFLLLTILIISCNNEATIQQLYVDSESNEDYIMLDIPMSLLEIPDTASEKEKQAYNSIKKVNLLAFKINESNKSNFTIEKTKVSKILKNPDYMELMRVNSKGYKIIAKYIGTEETAEELILYASNNKKGFILARVLGKDMKPANMLSLLNSLKNVDTDNEVFNKIEDFIK